MKGVAGVRQRTEVADHRVEVELLEPVDQGSFVVRLERLEHGAALERVRAAGLNDLGERWSRRSPAAGARGFRDSDR